MDVLLFNSLDRDLISSERITLRSFIGGGGESWSHKYHRSSRSFSPSFLFLHFSLGESGAFGRTSSGGRTETAEQSVRFRIRTLPGSPFGCTLLERCRRRLARSGASSSLPSASRGHWPEASNFRSNEAGRHLWPVTSRWRSPPFESWPGRIWRLVWVRCRKII